MATKIAVAGASGDLGGRIVRALLDRGAEVVALVRPGTTADKLAKLVIPGVTVVKVAMSDVSGLTQAFDGVSCVVSSLQGLRDVIIDVQSSLLDAAVAAGVPRFIPSDFSADFTKLSPGENRNFDLRREFHERLDRSPIASTSILNGAFTELLTSRMSFIDLGSQRVNYWGDADRRLDFTTMDDTASFTASAGLDSSAPRILRVAGDQISARELTSVASDVTGSTFELARAGSLDDLAAIIDRSRASDPESEKKVFPMWQGMQYMHNMFSGRARLEPLDNNRYPNLRWTTAREVIASSRNS